MDGDGTYEGCVFFATSTLVYVDPDKMIAARKAGASPWELHERAFAGEFAPETVRSAHTPLNHVTAEVLEHLTDEFCTHHVRIDSIPTRRAKRVTGRVTSSWWLSLAWPAALGITGLSVVISAGRRALVFLGGRLGLASNCTCHAPGSRRHRVCRVLAPVPTGGGGRHGIVTPKRT